jgi:hypothetical protein
VRGGVLLGHDSSSAFRLMARGKDVPRDVRRDEVVEVEAHQPMCI